MHGTLSEELVIAAECAFCVYFIMACVQHSVKVDLWKQSYTRQLAEQSLAYAVDFLL